MRRRRLAPAVIGVLLALMPAMSLWADDPGADPLPVRYDSREQGKAPVVKSQGQQNTCWALTATSALEAALMPDTHTVFSADHMALANGFSAAPEDGGDYQMIMAYLSGWQGPVSEKQDPYGDGKTDAALENEAFVQEIRLLNSPSASELKRAVLQYGPVQTSLHMDRGMTIPGERYYNAQTACFYDPNRAEATHDVLVLGWDDQCPAGDFAIAPPGDGAWICQNTWGEDFGENGIFYVSYYDANACRTGLVYAKVLPEQPYGQIYQMDECGWQGRLGYDTDECFFANVYTAEEDTCLKAVGLYCVDGPADYEIWLAHWFQDTASLRSALLLKEESIQGPGYYTIETGGGERLAEGERFAVMVRVRTEKSGKQAAVEVLRDSYTRNVTTLGKESYISRDGQIWENTQHRYGANICLKVFTSKS